MTYNETYEANIKRIVGADVYQMCGELHEWLSKLDTMPFECQDELVNMRAVDYQESVIGLLRDSGYEELQEFAQLLEYFLDLNDTTMEWINDDLMSESEIRTLLFNACTDSYKWKEIANILDASTDGQEKEIIEYWLVSSWLAEQLAMLDEPIAQDVIGLNIWGRTGEGSLYDDSAIREMAGRITRRMEGAA